MGCLLGQQSGRTVDISNSFEIKFEQGPGGIAINDAFLQKKMEQCECGRALAAGAGGAEEVEVNGRWRTRKALCGARAAWNEVNLGFYKALPLLAALETSARLHAPAAPQTKN